jgi:D-psicose/D-tagatose/L-ribulose 3-epimerase
VSIPSEEDSILRAASLGIEYVELTFAPPLKGRIRALSRALGSACVKVVSFHGPFGLAYDIGSFDPKGRREALKRHKEHLRYCAQLGATCYVIHPGFESYGYSRGGRWNDAKKVGTFPREESTIERLWKTNALSLAELADFAADSDVRIALETGPSNMITTLETVHMAKLAKRKNVGVCVDTDHVNVGGTVKPSDAIRQTGRLLWFLHLNDNKGDGDFHLPPGRGNIDWVAVARALREVSYDGVLNLELGERKRREDVWSEVKEGVAFLRRIFD